MAEGGVAVETKPATKGLCLVVMIAIGRADKRLAATLACSAWVWCCIFLLQPSLLGFASQKAGLFRVFEPISAPTRADLIFVFGSPLSIGCSMLLRILPALFPQGSRFSLLFSHAFLYLYPENPCAASGNLGDHSLGAASSALNFSSVNSSLSGVSVTFSSCTSSTVW